MGNAFLLAVFVILLGSSELFAQALTITTTSLPDGKVGVVYAAPALAATGGTPPYSWTVLTGSLPTGLALSTGGVISGTPTISGAFTFTVRVTDSATPTANTANKNFTIKVPPEITTTSLANGRIGAVYAQTLTAAPTIAAPLVWSIPPGSLPAGLTLSASDGGISGTPTTAGTFNFTVTLTDSSSPPLVGTKALSITIQPLLTITTASPLPLAVSGVFYLQTLQASGPSPVTWSIVSGIAPPGLSLASNGSLNGTPNVAGTFDFTVQATGGNPVQTVNKDFRSVVNAPLTITTPVALPAALVSTSYSASLAATGGVAPYTWVSQGTLPPGLSLTSGGAISGTPVTAGNFSFTVQVSDSFNPIQQVGRTFTLSVVGTLSVSTSTLPNGAINKPYSQRLTAVSGTSPYVWLLFTGGLPPGLSIASDGLISGNPESAGTFNFTVSVSDSSAVPQSASRALAITIQPTLTITTSASLPLAVAGVFYSQLLQAAGPSPLTWSVTSGITAPGLTLSSSGALAGTPTVGGTFDFTVQAGGGDPAQTATQALRIVVNDALSIVTPTVLPDAPLGGAYSFTLEARGGLAPYSWTNPGGGLPSGLTISSSGVLSGTASGVGNFTFVLQVADNFTPRQQVSRTFTLAVSIAPAITTLVLPNAIQNVGYSHQLQASGVTPFTWVVSAGTLPEGLTLTPAGLLVGTPIELGSKTFTVKVTDSRGANIAREFTLAVDPPVPSLSTPALPAILNTRQIAEVGLTLSSPHPSPLAGQLKLSFTPNAEVPSDDPATQFSIGSRTVNFTIPANTTSAVFTSRVDLLTGTVAGTVRLTASFENGPQDVAVTTVEIPAVAPSITDVQALRTSGGLDVQITGYAPSRRVSNVEFSFDLKVGTETQRVTLNRNIESEFVDWYRNAASTPFGSAFSYLQSFTIQGGDASAIEGVTIRLTNAQGSTSSATVRPR